MRRFLNLFGRELREALGRPWIWGSAVTFAGGTAGLLWATDDPRKALAAVAGLFPYVVPLLGTLGAAIELAAERGFFELVLAQPISRTMVFQAKFLAFSLAFSCALLLGLLPLLIAVWGVVSPVTLLLLVGTVTALAWISIGSGFLLCLLARERVGAIGAALVLWLYFAFLHDLVILWACQAVAGSAPDAVVLSLILINPIEVARLAVVLQLDIAALLGITGSILSRFFHGGGLAICGSALAFWIILPNAAGTWIFSRKDF
ncbi:MAG: ABC transporter permease subunit [Methylacidiphilaceae bacterium]|nr:ABC transporter permease subunit [Candidatus Methylacidiphilaceae bacterium]